MTINWRTLVGTFMALTGTIQLLAYPIITGAGLSGAYVWGWSVVPIVCGSFLIAAGEWFDNKHKDRRR